MSLRRRLILLMMGAAVVVGVAWMTASTKGTRELRESQQPPAATRGPIQTVSIDASPASPKSDHLSPDELKLVADALQTADSSLREIERVNSRIVGKIEGAEYFKEIAMITEPTVEQYAQFSAEISKAFEKLPEDLKSRTYTDQSRLLDEYTSFMTPFRVVVHGFSKPSSSDEFEYYDEKYVGDRDSVVVEGEKMTITDLRADRSRPDGGTRYGYLFGNSQ
jgi:hypothetical protein